MRKSCADKKECKCCLLHTPIVIIIGTSVPRAQYEYRRELRILIKKRAMKRGKWGRNCGGGGQKMIYDPLLVLNSEKAKFIYNDTNIDGIIVIFWVLCFMFHIILLSAGRLLVNMTLCFSPYLF